MNQSSEPEAVVQTLEAVCVPHWGTLIRLKIYTPDYQPLSWEQVWQSFVVVYPGRWAVEFFPPAEDLVNDAHVYHLWLLPEEYVPPGCLNLGHNYRSCVEAPDINDSVNAGQYPAGNFQTAYQKY